MVKIVKLKQGLIGIIVSLGLLFTAGNLFAASEVIIAEMNWSGAIAVSHVMKQVLEEKLGVPAKLEQLTPAMTWAGMDKGSVDVFSVHVVAQSRCRNQEICRGEKIC